jgi:hypothetical protein
LRGAAYRHLDIDCSKALTNREQLDGIFNSAFEPIWSVIGTRLVDRFVEKLAKGGTINIGGVQVTRDGIWVSGNWKILWWKAKPQFLRWPDVKIWSSEGTLYIGSRTNLGVRSSIQFNETDNAVVLSYAVSIVWIPNSDPRYRSGRGHDGGRARRLFGHTRISRIGWTTRSAARFASNSSSSASTRYFRPLMRTGLGKSNSES